MRRVKRYCIGRESVEEMIAAGRFNRSLEIYFRDRTGSHRHKISAGFDDEISVYREANLTCVLSVNKHMEYVGLEVFDGKDAVGDIFLQEEQLLNILGSLDLAPYTIINRLLEFIC